MRLAPLALATLATLAACHAEIDRSDEAGKGGDVHVQVKGDDDKNRVALDLPGFSANLSLPGLNLGEHMDLDGIKLAPGTKVTGVDIAGKDDDDGRDKGRVRIDFINPERPPAVIEHYRRSAGEAGYAVADAGSGLEATKGAKRFVLALAPDAAGSRGRITLSGD